MIVVVVVVVVDITVIVTVVVSIVQVTARYHGDNDGMGSLRLLQRVCPCEHQLEALAERLCRGVRWHGHCGHVCEPIAARRVAYEYQGGRESVSVEHEQM